MLARQAGLMGRRPPIQAHGIRREGAAGSEPEQLGFDWSGILVGSGHDGVIPDGWDGNGGARG